MNYATVEKITNKRPHPNADRLDLVDVLGYQCVTEKGLYENGDAIVYIRTDTVLPDTKWAEGYKKYSPVRVRAVNLRGEWSEGIIVPFDLLRENGINFHMAVYFGMDVSERIGVTKYVAPVSQDLDVISMILPEQLPATDEKRWEEYSDEELPLGEVCDITLKTDGSSTTHGYILVNDYPFVTNRSNELRIDKENNYTKPYHDLGVGEKLKGYCTKYNISLALRGEVYGNNIQFSSKNHHSKIKGVHIAYFSTYIMERNKRGYANKGSQHYYINVCRELGLPTVELLEENVILTKELIEKYSSGITTINGLPFEGVVVKHAKGSFKIINKNYDSKK